MIFLPTPNARRASYRHFLLQLHLQQARKKRPHEVEHGAATGRVRSKEDHAAVLTRRVLQQVGDTLVQGQ